MPSLFPCSPVIREWLWKKTQVEKKKKMWHGQPLTWILLFFLKTWVIIGFLFPTLTAVLSRSIATQFFNSTPASLRVPPMLSNNTSAVADLHASISRIYGATFPFSSLNTLIINWFIFIKSSSLEPSVATWLQ